MTDVWLVTSGCYSDFRVEFACESEAKAVEFAERMGGDHSGYGYRAESVPLVADLVRVEELQMSAKRDDFTGEWTEDVKRDLYWAYEVEQPLRKVARSGWVFVAGTDHERVRKVYGDTLAQLKADAAGLT